jgi:hypothetical protein
LRRADLLCSRLFAARRQRLAGVVSALKDCTLLRRVCPRVASSSAQPLM